MSIGGRYREVAALYSSQSLPVRAYVYLRLALRLLKVEQLDHLLPTNGLVVDFGCGYGLLANLLALGHPDRRVLGVDADRHRIDVARATVGSRTNIEFDCQDASRLNLPPMRGAVMTDFLHHLPESLQGTLLSAIAQALEPGGTLLIREVNPDHRPRWKYWCSILAEVLIYPSPRTTKLRNRKPAELIRELGFLGLEAEVRRADRHSPFAVVLYVCRKRQAAD